MPRAGWKKPVSDRRLADVVSVGVLERVFPPGLVDEVIAGCGRTEQRRRALPARSMAYFAMGMALHQDGSYEDVLGLISDGLAWADRDPDGPVVLAGKAAIFHARQRLGPEPMAALFERVATPIADPGSSTGWLVGRRLVAIDGTCLDVADSPVNDEHFGRPGVMKGERAAFPQARLVAVAECATHAIFDAQVGRSSDGERQLSVALLERLEPGMLCLADRGFYSSTAWQTATATGADLLWRVKTGKSAVNLAPVQELPDGSWLAEVRPPTRHRTAQASPFTVRVVEYRVDDGRSNDETYRLITTLLDPEQASATDLAVAYTRRWEIETAFDELKTHQRGPRTVLRSKSPDLVLQEIWGHLCCHYAIRVLMADAATSASAEPERVSFIAALRIARRSIAQQGAFSP